MSTIEATVSMMEGLCEESRVKVLDYVKLLYMSDTLRDPFPPLSADEILDTLAESREQVARGDYVPAEEAIREIGIAHGFL